MRNAKLVDKEKKHKEIELRSEEVQEVMNKVPSWILRYGITVLFCIVIVLIVGSYLFKYPDVITAEVTISTQGPPAYVLARASGRVYKLYVSNGQVVKENAVLGVIENVANAEDVFSLRDQMAFWAARDYSLDVGKQLFGLSGQMPYRKLGKVQTSYASFVSVLSEVIRAREMGYYSRKLEAHQGMLVKQEKYYSQIQNQNRLVEKGHRFAQSAYKRDSILYHRNAMIISEFEESGSRYLQSLQSRESSRMALTQTSIQIEQAKEILLDIRKQALEEEQTQAVNLKNATEELSAQLSSWEQDYVLKAPVAGRVTFLSVWSSNQNVESGATVFVVAPEKESLPLGQALLPLHGSGKVKSGQSVNLRLNNYPDQEFGYLRGEVKSVSPVPTADGLYVVDIALPNGLRTNYGKELPMTREMKGTADIVTADVRLIERLIMPLKKIWEAQKNNKFVKR